MKRLFWMFKVKKSFFFISNQQETCLLACIMWSFLYLKIQESFFPSNYQQRILVYAHIIWLYDVSFGSIVGMSLFFRNCLVRRIFFSSYEVSYFLLIFFTPSRYFSRGSFDLLIPVVLTKLTSISFWYFLLMYPCVFLGGGH